MGKQRTALSLLLILCLVISTLPIVRAIEDSWATLEPMPTARGGLGVAVVNGKIYAIGGFVSTNEEYNPYSKVNEEYDPATNTWTTKKDMPTGRNHFGITVYKNKIYVIGGCHQTLSNTGVNEAYDPATDSWETMSPMPTPRSTRAHVVNDRIYLIGGISWVTNTQANISDLNEIYDPATDTWIYGKPIPTAVSSYASAVLDNKIYVIGGLLSPQGAWTNLTQVYDPKTDSWSLRTSSPLSANFAIAEATTGVMSPKRIYLFDNSKTQVYDPEKDVWDNGSSMPTSRFFFAVAVVNDKLYAIGGSPLGLDIYDPPIHNAENEEYTPSGYIPEFPSWTPLLITLVALIAVTFIYRRRISKSKGEAFK